jgi:hypothetical protein
MNGWKGGICLFSVKICLSLAMNGGEMDGRREMEHNEE